MARLYAELVSASAGAAARVRGGAHELLARRFFGDQTELALVALLGGILLVLFAPIPPGLLDFLLIANFSFALLILLLTFYMGAAARVLDVPVAAAGGDAVPAEPERLRDAPDPRARPTPGHVIAAVGNLVVGGNYVIGLIVFLVLIVVQFVVVTNGAQRVAEVAARFTLDTMPGKQMSIDADLNMGLIDQNEARERRKQIEKEANFYGAMDGASRFVKGDAIAGILIILVNIIGGLTIGVAQHGHELGRGAVHLHAADRRRRHRDAGAGADHRHRHRHHRHARRVGCAPRRGSVQAGAGVSAQSIAIVCGRAGGARIPAGPSAAAGAAIARHVAGACFWFAHRK